VSVLKKAKEWLAHKFVTGGFSLLDPGSEYLRNGYYGIYQAAYGNYVNGLGYLTNQKALSSSAVFACVKIISEDVGSLPLFLYKRGTGNNRSVADNEPLYSVLHDAPNPDMHAMAFREAITAHALLGAGGRAKIERSGGKVTALWLMMPNEVTKDKDLRGRPYFIWRRQNMPQVTLKPEDVFELNGFGMTGTEGLDVLQHARQTIGLSLTLEEYAAKFFSQDQTPNLVLEHPGKVLGPEGVKGIKKAWAEQSEWHAPRVLQEGMKATQLHPDNDKAQMTEARAFQLLEVCRLFRMPPHKLAEMGRATWGNISDQNTQYYNETLRPWLVRWEQSIKRCCLGDEPRLFAEHSLEGFLRGDFDMQTTGFSKMIACGVYSINEVRAFMNLNPIDGGDEHFIPMNSQELIAAANALTSLGSPPSKNPQQQAPKSN